MYAEIVVDIKIKSLDKPFDYQIPDELIPYCEIGMSVLVPFKHQMVKGIITKLKNNSEYEEIKMIEALDSFMPIINEKQWELIDYLKKTYRLMLSQAFDIVMPTVFQSSIKTAISLIKDHEYFRNNAITFNDLGIYQLKKTDYKHLKKFKELSKEGYIDFSHVLSERTFKKITAYRYDDNQLDTFRHYTDLLYTDKIYRRKDLIALGISSSGINTLVKYGILKIIEDKKTREKVILNRKNVDIHNSIYIQSKHVFMERLKQFIEKHQDTQNSLLILVPNQHVLNLFKDINYTKVLYYHGSLSVKEKQKVIQNIDEAHVVIGTRSALFLPFKDLKTMIVIDAHDSSYQLNKGIYYDTLDIINEKFSHVNIIYQSFVLTPFLNQLKNRFEMYQFPLIPQVEIISMREELINGHSHMLSRKLQQTIEETLDKNNKVFLIHQRKGYHLVNTCRYCAYVSKCETCHSPYHVNEHNIMHCSQCGNEKSFEQTCPNHHKNMMKPIGIGLDLVVKQLKKKYPNMRIGKIDKDTKDVIGCIQSHDMIVGTSIMKYYIHQYPNALIGVLIADVLWHHFDQNIEYEAWTQLLSLTNLELPNKSMKTYIQTYDTDHSVIKGLTHLQTFLQTLQSNLEMLMLPPIYIQYESMIFDQSYLKAYQKSLKIKNELKSFGHIVGPRKRYETDDFFTLTFKIHRYQLHNFLNQIDVMNVEVYPI